MFATNMACGTWTQLSMDAETVTFTLVHLYLFSCTYVLFPIASFVIDNFNAATIALSNVATAVIVYCLGVLIGAVMYVCCGKFQCGIQRKRRVPPKDIELRDNPAYGPIQKRRQ